MTLIPINTKYAHHDAAITTIAAIIGESTTSNGDCRHYGQTSYGYRWPRRHQSDHQQRRPPDTHPRLRALWITFVLIYLSPSVETIEATLSTCQVRRKGKGNWKPPWPPRQVRAEAPLGTATHPGRTSSSFTTHTGGCPTEKFSQPAICFLLPIQDTCPVPVTTPHQGLLQCQYTTRPTRNSCSLLKIVVNISQPVNCDRGNEISSQDLYPASSPKNRHQVKELILLQNTLFLPRYFYRSLSPQPTPVFTMTTRPSRKSPSSLLAATKASSART